MRKIICLILTLIFTLQIGFAAEEVQGDLSYNAEELSKAVYILNDLGITALQEEAEIWQNKAVSRAEFAEMVCKAFKINTSSDKVYFVDVPYDMWAYKSVTAMTESGFVSVPEDRSFRPNDNITYAEALKMILCAANYGIYAEANGGFPYGYTKTASRMKLGVYAGENTGLTVAAAVTLLYDVMSMGFYEPQAYSDVEAVQYREADKIIFAVLWDTYIERGIIQAYYGAGYNAEVNEKNEVIIDGIEYKLAHEINLNDYFLSEIEFIYKKSGDNPGEIFYIEGVGESNEIIISSDDVSGFENESYAINYYKNEKLLKRNLQRGCNIVYNGAAYGGSIENVINEFTSGTKSGMIKIKEVDGRDVVIIKAFRNLVAGYADSAAGRLFNKFDSSDCVDLNEYTQVAVKTLEGAETTLDFSVTPMLLAVAEAKDKSIIEIVICRDKLTGQIDEVGGNGSEMYFVIGGTRYELDSAMYKNQMLDDSGNEISSAALLGAAYDFYIDNFGRLAYMNVLGAGNGFSIGYIVDGVINDGVFADEIKVKVLTETAGVVEYIIKDKVVIDGISYKLSNKDGVIGAIRKGEQVNSVTAEDGHLAQQIIRYKADEESKAILEIDTAYVETDENEDNTLTLVIGDGTTAYDYKATAGLTKLGHKILLSNANTKFFAKPLLNSEGNVVVLSTGNGNLSGDIVISRANNTTKTELHDKSGNPYKPDDSMYRTGIVRGFVSDIAYAVCAYKYNPDTPYCDALVYNYEEYVVPADQMMVEEISDMMGTDGEISKMLTGWVRGAKVSYEIADNSDTSDLECGDIVYLWKDTSGRRVTFVKKVYDCGNDEFVNRPYNGDKFASYLWNVEADGGYWRENALSKGLVLHKKENMLAWDWDGNYRTYEEAFDFTSVPIVICDKDARNNKIYVGSVAEIPDYKSVGEENAARIVMNTDRLRGVCAFVYLNY